MESPYYFHCFASKLAEIYVKVNIRPLTMVRRLLVTFRQNFMVGHHNWPVLASLLSRECWFHQLPQRQFVWCICVNHPWTVVVCKSLSENIIVITPTTIQPVIIENNVQFSGLGLSRREMSRTILECHRMPSKKSFYWLRHRFPLALRQNGRTSRAIPRSWHTDYQLKGCILQNS